jgi:3-methyl-2-oxobutanoate hydroxymethyltransferase
MPDHDRESRVTIRTVRQWVDKGEPFPMLTCYDATTAGWLWRGGVKCLLVGDTAAQVILGHDSTLPAPMPFMVEITAAVRRGAPNAFVMADMPMGSYQCGDDHAVENAIRFLTDGSADAVKLEVGPFFAPLVARLSEAGVPVVAHIGSRPQLVRLRGGYGSVGRVRSQADQLVQTAKLMVESGASMLLIEAVPAEVAHRMVEAVNQLVKQTDRPTIPVVGCGAGPSCHGHVVVLHDLLGLTSWQPPFATPIAALGPQISAAATQWTEAIRSGQYPPQDHPYKTIP